MEQRIYLSPPYMCGNEKKYIEEAFEANWIAPLGENVTVFEKDIARRVGVKYATATNSGTAAIHLALRYFNCGQGDIVFCSDLTFAASCNPILYQGAKPVFIDSEPGSYNMSPNALRNAFRWAKKEGKLPKAVIIVDLYGWSADFDALLSICREYDTPVIEDSAEALGSRYNGRPCGSFGDIGIFSFNGNKIITSSGGGMAVSNDQNAIEKMLFWATQARERELHYEHKEYGYNYRLSNICAGIGRGQLEKLDEKIRLRKGIYDKYNELLYGTPLQLVPIEGKGEPNFWLSILSLDPKINLYPHQICEALEKENIESRPAWKPMHMQPLFEKNRFFPHEAGHIVSEDVFKHCVCLPSGEAMTVEEQRAIINLIIDMIKDMV